MGFQGKVVVVTGGAQGIGKCICEAFAEQGAHVCVIDLLPNGCFQGDVADPDILRQFADKVIAGHGHVDVLVNNAKPSFKGLSECSYDEFDHALRVGIAAPFLLAKLFRGHFASGASIINISSSRDRMSQPESESYTAAKGGLHALTHALAMTLAGKVRVNSISPGWIDTQGRTWPDADHRQHPAGRIGTPQDIADMVLFLASDKAGFITGENICIDGGMTRQMIYHADGGWRFGQ